MVRKWFLDKDEPLEVVPVAMSESPIDKVGHGGEDMDRDMGKLEDLGKFLGVSFEGFEEDFNDVLKDI